jgi:hypothetical protein
MSEKNVFGQIAEVNELVIESNYAIATITDAEGDELKCTFLNDQSVSIDTSELENIVLDRNTLKLLTKLLRQADDYFDSEEYKNLPENQIN